MAATDKKLNEIKEARKASDKARRNAYKLSKVDKDRKIMLVGKRSCGQLRAAVGARPISTI
ncbi:hypothetical protein PQR75_06060 [Paraburkholderia fungorum]|uniref:hypothetical protein n=1 Tax=Paraburkholderia fungorum TaxID=134537 RepID=UPI0038BB2528